MQKLISKQALIRASRLEKSTIFSKRACSLIKDSRVDALESVSCVQIAIIVTVALIPRKKTHKYVSFYLSF